MPRHSRAAASAVLPVLALVLAAGACAPFGSSAPYPSEGRAAVGADRSSPPSRTLRDREPVTAEQTPAPEPDPATAVADRDGAAAAGAHALHLYDHAVRTSDGTSLAAMCAPGTTWCEERLSELEFRAVTPADRAPRRRSSQHEVHRAGAEPLGDGTWRVEIDALHTLTTSWTDEISGTQIIDVGGRGDVRYEMRLTHRPTGWVLLDVTAAPLG